MNERSEQNSDNSTSRSSAYLDGSGVYHRPRKTAPPLGLVPRKFWIENRADDILEAMERYRRGKYIIPVEWVDELADHLRTLDQFR